MKSIFKSVAIAAVATVVSTSALAAQPEKNVRFVGDTQFAGFCRAVVMDDLRILRASLARNVGRVAASQREVLRLVTAEEGLTCNGASLIEFSRERDANAILQYITARS